MVKYLERKIAYAAFDIAREKGNEFWPDVAHRGGYKYKSKRFEIEFMFADGPDFGGRDLSDCSYLKIKYNGKSVFHYNPLDNEASYRTRNWIEKLDQLESRILPKKDISSQKPKDWEDDGAEMAAMDRSWLKYGRSDSWD